jgi:hypothetical protein
MNHRNIAWSDAQILEILHLHHNEGLAAAKVATRFGTTKSAIIGLCNRVSRDTDPVDASPHLNGTMRPRWWLAGVKKQPRAGI